MNRSEKEELVSQVKEKLLAAKSIVITRQSGLTVSEATELRRMMRESGTEFKVIKNTLARLAVAETPLEGVKGMLEGPTAIAFSMTDPIGAAKIASKFANLNEKLKIVGGYLDGQVLNDKAVETLAKLPSLDELRSKILGVICAPATKIAVLAKEPAALVARVLAARGRV